MKKISLLLAFLGFIGLQVVFAQTRELSGVVTSGEDGSSIPGASVVVKGTTLGTVTDMEGKFSLKVPQNAKTLVVSFVGMTSAEVPVTGASKYAVKLRAESIAVDEVIVTAMGITRKPKEMGVATAKVDNAELTQAGASNVMNGLTAKVSGLQINTINNGVNPDTKITLRGNRHFLASNQALVVLDGVPVDATFLNSVNPNDIESVNILKGASAAALYGNDASNGVLIVTTKRGDKGKMTIKVSNITTFEQVSYLPNLQNMFGSGSNETPQTNDPNYTFWIGPDRNTQYYTAFENQSYGPQFNGQMVILGGVLADGSYQMVPYSAVKNQKLAFFNTAIKMQNDVSLSTGDEVSHFYLSMQDVHTNGTVPYDSNRRTGARMAAGRTYGIFTADYTISVMHTTTSTSGGDYYQQRPVYWNVMNTPAEVPLESYKDIYNNPFAGVNGYYNAYYPNPYWQLHHARNNDTRNDVLGSISLDLKPLKWLDLSDRTGIIFNTITDHDYRDEVDLSAYISNNPWSAGSQASVFPGFSSDQVQQTLILTNDFLATADHKFGKFNVKGILGSSVYSQRYESQFEQANGLVIPYFYNISNRVGQAAVSQSTQQRNSLGVFADATVGYNNYAFLHASARNDWDSRLTQANRSFFYPSADASLVLSEMFPTIIANPVLSFLKVRGGWSQTGQIALSNWYGTLPSYPAASGFPYGSNSGFNLSTTLSNPLLKPEKTTEIEVGTEVSFMKNKIHLEANVYQTNTKNQTIPATVSAATGYLSALINAGELQNQGLELDLKFTPILRLGDFRWNGSVNYAYFQSKVLSILPGITDLQIPVVANSGGEATTSVSYATVGKQFPNIEVTDVNRDPQGHIIVDAITGLPSTASALVNIGHGNPNSILGLNTDFSYKGFKLSAVAEYRGGNVICNYVGQGAGAGGGLDFTGVTEHSALNNRQNFIIPNSVIQTSPGVYVPNTNTLVAVNAWTFWQNSSYPASERAYTTSAAFWKLREVALTYDIPVKRIFGTNIIQMAQVGLVGRNLLMLRPKTNIWTDPEFNSSTTSTNAVGFTDTYQTPPTRLYGFSLKLTF